jgi:hypothetical protein
MFSMRGQIRREISALSQLGRNVKEKRNTHHAKADWQFTTADARVTLKRLYPQFE